MFCYLVNLKINLSFVQSKHLILSFSYQPFIITYFVLRLNNYLFWVWGCKWEARARRMRKKVTLKFSKKIWTQNKKKNTSNSCFSFCLFLSIAANGTKPCSSSSSSSCWNFFLKESSITGPTTFHFHYTLSKRGLPSIPSLLIIFITLMNPFKQNFPQIKFLLC